MRGEEGLKLWGRVLTNVDRWAEDRVRAEGERILEALPGKTPEEVPDAPPVRRPGDHAPARFQHTPHLRDDPGIVINVLHDVKGNHEIKHPVRVGERPPVVEAEVERRTVALPVVVHV